MKGFLKKAGFVLIRLPSILLILGCLFIFISNNILSFGFSLLLPELLFLNIITGVYWLLKKNKLALLSILGLIVYFLCFDSFLQLNSSKLIELDNSVLKPVTLSILTYNANGFKHDNNDIDEQIVNFIKSKNPDVFCIQEFSAIKYKYFKDYPFWYKTNIFTVNKSVMAVFSKYPIMDKGYIEFPDSSNGAMYVDLKKNEKIVRVYNIHLESFKIRKDFYNFSEVTGYNSLRYRISKAEKMRKDQADILISHISKFDGKTVICGDFNSTQFSYAYRNLKNSKKDTFIESGYGFGGTYSRRNYPFRIDFILVDNDIDVLSHQNFNLKLSDHEPIFTSLVIN